LSLRLISLLVFPLLSVAQPQFEVASIKMSSGPGPIRFSGGPETETPTRVTGRRQTLFNLICQAYGVPGYLVAGPEWLATQTPGTPRFDFDANVPLEATRAEFGLMLQRFLAERFALQTHRERRESTVLHLKLGKDAPKLHANTDPPAPEGTPIKLGPPGPDGFPTVPPGLSNLLPKQDANGMQLKFVRVDMARLALNIANLQSQPAVDDTGLNGNYDFILRFAFGGASDNTEPDLPTAIQEQLNLKLVPGKAPVEFLVVDRAAKLPTGN